MSLQMASLTFDPPVFLAPLAGITDLPFRNLVSSFGAGLVVSEMIASHEIIQAKPGAHEKAELGFGVENTAVQIAGREARWMTEAAKLIEGSGARLIDINMGCPAKKVVNGYSGSALMRDLDHALNLIDAVVAAVNIPVTLKTRLGWDETLMNAPELARRAESAGIQMITIHGRTRCQFFKGRADWSAIRAVKETVKIPVIANGDIVSPETGAEALELSGADGVMIGRGAQGAPWRLAEVAAALFGTPAPKIPTGADLTEMVSSHYDAMISFYGEKLGNRVARKHLGWYMDGVNADPGIRKTVLTEKDPAKVLRLLPDALASQQREMVA